ncbi:MAG TPA: acyltransferase [Saprospiraceae bacterium]|nr:acyltransferase [Saprospiraceae bacterium]
MHKLAQNILSDQNGHKLIEGDWFPAPLPDNIVLEEMSYPDTTYSFASFFSEKPVGFRLGYASGNYGHCLFSAGKKGEIKIGDFVALQCTRFICNSLIEIHDHCMVSWGAVITDSWIIDDTITLEMKRRMLEDAAYSDHRHLEFIKPQKVTIHENVWIGFEAIILPGVTIGRGAIVGSKSVVSTDVPPYAVVVGNPGRIVKYLEPTDTKELKEKAIRELVRVA